MVIGGDGYQYRLSRLSYSFRGGLGMEYLENQSIHRIKELEDHSRKLAEEVKNG